MALNIETFFDESSFTLTYIVYDENTLDSIIIDPVADYDQAASIISYESIDKLMSFINREKLNIHYILETHAHADHLTGAAELKKRIPNAKVGISKHITQVQDLFKGFFNFEHFNPDGDQFDILLDEITVLKAGSIEVNTIFTPGHTPACASFKVEDLVFTGDSLFMPDYGTGRCDFPAGSSKQLYHSVHEKLYSLPDNTRVFTGHDYMPGDRELKYESTIGEQKMTNVHIKESTTEAEFVKFRDTRDAGLNAPKLLLPSIQANITAGNFPPSEENDTSYFKIPVRFKESS